MTEADATAWDRMMRPARGHTFPIDFPFAAIKAVFLAELAAARAAFVADVRKFLPCLCHDSYKSRGMTDPACPWHVYAAELLTEEEFNRGN